MEHPGPPRFAAVGDEIELAPRDPNPDATYNWTITEAPSASTVKLGDEPVVHFEPDTAGRYRITHETPEDSYEVTVRVFGERRSPEAEPTRQQYSGTEPPTTEDHTVPETDATEATTEDPGSGIRRLDEEARPERPRIQLSAALPGETSRTLDSEAATDTETGTETATDTETGTDGDAGETDTDTTEQIVVETTVDAVGDTTVEYVVDDRDRDSLPEEATTVEDGVFHVDPAAVENRLRVHAVAVGDTYSVPDQIEITRVSESEFEVSRPYDPPEWALDSVVYEVYVRTFAGDDDEGSTADDGSAAADDDSERSVFDRIRARLDYLVDLGVDVLWLTPVLQNDHAPHGYNITDFFDIAADLGGREDYEELIEAAHDHDMRVVFDLVLNHSARAHPFFMDAYGEGANVGLGEGSPNPDSDYYDWYDWQDTGEPETYFEWEHIANFQFDTLAVRRHLLDAVDEWAPLVDGFRCDMAWAVPNSFWREIHDRVKAREESFWLLDETIPYIPEFQAGLFDTHFDSTTAFQLREIGAGDAPADSLLEAVAERRRIGFPEHASFMVYAENHDESRYVAKCGVEPAFAAAGAVATLPGTPMVYAGQELGQLGRRDSLVWSEANERLQNHYRQLLALRHRVPALAARASLDRVEYSVTEGDPDRVVAYHRAADADGDVTDDDVDTAADASNAASAASDVVVVLNFGEGTATVSLVPPVEGYDLVSDERVDTDPVTVDSVAVLPAE
jgi:glycosidase